MKTTSHFLLVDFPVNRSQSPTEIEREQEITATSGQKCLELSRNVNRNVSLAKMFLVSSNWHSNRCSLIWKEMAITPKHSLFRLVPKMHLTKETEFGLLPIRRTSKTSLHGTIIKHKTKILPEKQKIWFWPTPLASDGSNSTMPPSMKKRSGVIGELLRAGITGELNPEYIEWLMGYPKGWTELKPSEMPLYRK